MITILEQSIILVSQYNPFMLSYLLLNNQLDAALNLGSKRSFEAELLQHFNAGDCKRFFQIFHLLSKNQKLQFYIHIYFLIYPIHPHTGKQHHIPKQSLREFKQYIDSKGSQLAKTNQFLQFYALPYIKQPLQHPTFKSLFKKDWIQNLNEKLKIFIKKEIKRMTEESEAITTTRKSQSKLETSANKRDQSSELQQYIDRYNNLQSQYRSVIAITNSNMIQSQSKWFQIVKQLVQCSRSLINLISRHNKQLTSERKFLNIRKKIDRFEKFVSQRLEDMISQSQDISMFDRPSMNQISCTIAATQKSYSHNFPDLNPLMIEQYIPSEYKKMADVLNRGTKQKGLVVIKGLIFRLVKSKDNFVRRQHIIGILQDDVLGVRSGNIKNHLQGHLKEHVLQLMTYIEYDYYGRSILFSSSVIKQLIHILKTHSGNNTIIQYITSIFQHLSVQEKVKLELTNNDIIKYYLSLLADRLQSLNQTIIERIAATLLNLTSTIEGLDKLQNEESLFNSIGSLLQSSNPITRVIINGIIFNALGRRKIYDDALEVGLNNIISYLIENDKKAHLKELKYIQNRLKKFTPWTPIVRNTDEPDDTDDIFDEQQQPDFEDDQINLQQYLKAHEAILKQFSVDSKEAKQQSNYTRTILQTSLRRLKQRQSLQLIENESKKFKQIEDKKQFHAPLVNSYMSPREKRQRQSEKVHVQNSQSMHVAQFASVVVDPVTNFSPGNKIKPRQYIVQKLNDRIKANRKEQSQRNESSVQKRRHLSFNQQNRQSSLIGQNSSRHSKAYQSTQQYQQAFGAKPRLVRSPPRSPR